MNRTFLSICVAVATALLVSAATSSAQPRQPSATLRLVVKDPSGAVIPGATVQVTALDAGAPGITVQSDGQGVAVAASLSAGRFAVTVSFPGFETQTIPDLRVRAGENRRDVTLTIRKLDESVSVGRDRATDASDPRSDRFANVLTKQQIDALPDDPDEMEQLLKDMAGPGATLRVDGFRGGKLPPKSQIRSIRFGSGMFAAENHGGGLTIVDIATQPGLGPMRGSVDLTFRDGAMNARNAFQARKGPEQSQQYTVNLSGTLLKERTSFSLSAGGASLYDSANIFAALTEGTRTATARRPAERLNITGRLDHALSKSHTLRAAVQQDEGQQQNLGVGGFELADRAFERSSSETLLRLSESGPLRRGWFGESRLQLRRGVSDASASIEAPAVRVLDAFTAGGAQQAGGRRTTDIEAATNIDWARGRHAVRMGALFEGGWSRSDSRTNYLGTYTFASLADYEAGTPATYTQRTGDALVEYSQWQAGLYIQDDWRARKNLTLSGGVRQELQTHLGDGMNLGPRAGLTWSPFKNGKTTVRAGGGRFYEWLEAEVYEQTLRVDGVRQQDLVVSNPGYPDALTGGGLSHVLPPSRYQLAGGLVMPERDMLNAGFTQQLSPTVMLNVNAMHMTGRNRFRGRNVNAPVNGVRPDPATGNVTQVESTSRMTNNQMMVGINVNLPARRMFVFANYALIDQRNDADGALSLPADSYDLAAEWGPAAGVPRHVGSAVVNVPLFSGFRLGLTTSARSGTRYNITTGRDDNGDTVFNDRPAGVGRNSAIGKGMWDVAARLTWSFGFGERPPAGPGGGTMIVQRIGGGTTAGDLLNGLPGGGPDDKRIRIDLFASAQNMLNSVAPIGYSGVMTSPFFGQPTAAMPARRVDVGMRVAF